MLLGPVYDLQRAGYADDVVHAGDQVIGKATGDVCLDSDRRQHHHQIERRYCALFEACPAALNAAGKIAQVRTTQDVGKLLVSNSKRCGDGVSFECSYKNSN